MEKRGGSCSDSPFYKFSQNIYYKLFEIKLDTWSNSRLWNGLLSSFTFHV